MPHLWIAAILAFAPVGSALAASPPPLPMQPAGFDHLVTPQDDGIWSRKYQHDLVTGAALVTVAGALFTDHDSRLGRTFGQSLDAMVFTGATTTAMKYTFTRARPNESSDPGDFFAGSGHHSFPSGEVAQMTAVVTPFIAEYHHDHPAVWALAVLPAWDAVARVKSGQHWQSDVVVGAAIGVAWGRWAHHRKHPVLIGLLPEGGVGLRYEKTYP